MDAPEAEISTAAPPPSDPLGNDANPDYWDELIDRREAGRFVKLAPGTLDNFRQSGIGPVFIKLTARCIRYRRRDLKAWADSRVRRSTSDPGPDVKAA